MNNKQRMKSGIILGIFTLIFLTIFAFIAPRARAEITSEFSLYQAYGFKYSDVNKPREDNGEVIAEAKETCVHAAMANAIIYSSNGTQKEAYELYAQSIYELGSDPSNPLEVWEWLMSSIDGTTWGKYNNLFLLYDPLNRYFSDIMKGMLQAGWVALPVIEAKDVALKHIITVYGYRVFDDGSMYFTYVDSDDDYYGTKRAIVENVGGKTFLKYDIQEDKTYRRAKITAVAFVRVVGE